jgi:voltage-gated potassium channel
VSETSGAKDAEREQLRRERFELLRRLEGWLETPMLVLAFVWLVLLVLELTRGESRLFSQLGTGIWIVFVVDFAVKLVLAPDKSDYFKSNWLTVLVTFAGAAGMYAFEREAPGGPSSYGESLWWTAMIMTTLGSQFWPHTGEGRVLCVALAFYAFGVFGYVTATLATFFVGRDATRSDAELAGAEQLAGLRTDVSALREEVRALTRELGSPKA